MKLKNLSKYRAVIVKAREWLLKRQQPDGSFEGGTIIQVYYNAVNFLVKVGAYEEAARLADWIAANYLKPDGDFRGNPDSRSAQQKALRHIYMDGWLVHSFQRMGRFDLSMAGLKYINSFQDNNTGGFWSAADPDYTPRRELLELSGASTAILAMLYCGQLNRVKRAADFICMLVDSQPDFSRYLYTVYKPGSGLITNPPVEMFDAYVVDCQKDWAWYWQLGFAMHALGKTYLATKQKKYLQTAKLLFDFFEHCREDRFQALASGKVAWGTAILYKVTGEQRYLKVVEQILDNFADIQLPDGTWFNFPYFKSAAEQPVAPTYEITIELAYLIAEVISI
jgi:hypothetical protein